MCEIELFLGLVSPIFSPSIAEIIMRYLLLVDNEEVEMPDEKAVEESLRRGDISSETWIKLQDVESDWETVAEKFPHLDAG